jgi:proteasome lid subunit RPN8/RPN11
MNELFIPRKLTQKLLHLAQVSPDQEVCGLVGGQDNVATSCYPINNISAQPTSRFELDPKQQIAAMKTMRDKGEQLLAIYHSHPGADAKPSQRDIQLASYPDAVYLIISLNTKGVLEIRGFHIQEGQALEIKLTLTP